MNRKYTRYIVIGFLGIFVASTVLASCAPKAKCGSTRRSSKKKWLNMGT